MNNAGYIASHMIIVLNDNGQVSLPIGNQSAGGVRAASQLNAYISNLLMSQKGLLFEPREEGLPLGLKEDGGSLEQSPDAGR